MKTKRKVWKENWEVRRKIFTVPLERYVKETNDYETLTYETTVIRRRFVVEIIRPTDSRWIGYRSEGSTEKIATDNLQRLLDGDGFSGEIKAKV